MKNAVARWVFASALAIGLAFASSNAVLAQDKVRFQNLALAIIDEQHRFGVEQRRMIKEKGELHQHKNNSQQTHFLSMTATPIPRSLALMLYGDLAVSRIRELPAGRKPIHTTLIEPAQRDQAYQTIRAEVQKGRQVFVICPLIAPTEISDDSEHSIPVTDTQTEKKTVLTEYEHLSKKIFPDLTIGFLHGKLKGDEKDAIMTKFANNELSILVATSVVEVGVNIPNATIMMIEGADRFGLAQLHQFRGRVGRSDHQSYCFLFTDSRSPSTKERLQFFASCRDGFALAEKDLELRGPGDVYGTEQSGMHILKLATLRDSELLEKARHYAQTYVSRLQEFPTLQKRIAAWEHDAHFE